MSVPSANTPVVRPGFLARVRDYARPRPGTSGDLPSSSSASGVLGGAFQGYVAGGPIGAAAGALGGYVGVKAGEKAGSFAVAVGAGAAAGAAIGAVASAASAAMVGGPIGLGLAAGGALVGGFSGAVGALSGSRRAATRDSVYGGMLAGAIASVYTGNPAMMIAGAAGAGMGGRAVKPAGRIVLGAVTGAAAGAMAGVMAGPQAMLAGAVAGAVIGPIGALVGPTVRQVQRNMTMDLTVALNKRVEPWIEKHPLGTKGKLVAGAAMGALMIGPVGLLFGATGVAVTASVGAAAGAVQTWRFLKKREAAEKAARLHEAAARVDWRLGAPVGVLQELKQKADAAAPAPATRPA